MLALYLFTRGYPALSGAAAAASVGYWHGAVVFPLLVVGMSVREGDVRALWRTVAGGVAFTALMLLPVFVRWHSSSEMLVQTVLVPLTDEEPAAIGERLLAGVFQFKWASPLVLLGGAGLARAVPSVIADRNDPLGREEWWVPAGAAWFAFVVLFVDFETGGYTDLIPGLAFVAIGIGLVATGFHRQRRWHVLVGAIAAVLLVNVAFLGSFGLVFTDVATPGPVPMSDLERNDRAIDNPALEPVPDARYIYWHTMEPTTCHYRLSSMDIQWLERLQRHSSDRCVDLTTALDELSTGPKLILDSGMP